jgi:hypothetical protein
MDALYIQPAAASARFGVSRRTLDRWARFGWISTSRVGRVRLYRLVDIQRVIDAGTTAPTETPITTLAPEPTLPEQWWVTDFWADADLTAAGRGRRR